jgi:hypothetical protein
MNNVKEIPHSSWGLGVVMAEFSAKLRRVKFLWEK